MTDFEKLGVPHILVQSLGRMQITAPTPIQKATIPLALNGQDILASAQTGSGKTIAYSIPLLVKLLDNKKNLALILTPTRELSMQVHQTLNALLGNTSPFKTALLIGGASMSRQLSDLKKSPQLIVGTPGRVTDHLMRGSLALDKACFLIIDEADRMLDMGFGVQLEKIAEYLPIARQTLMFSATLPKNIEKLSQKYLRDPERVSIDSSIQVAPEIKQEVIYTANSEKFSFLLKELDKREGSIITFVKTKRGAERLSRELKHHGHSADAIHGDLKQRQRERVIYGFRNRRSRIMVATDVASRGLDIPHVMHVINYDMPQSPEDYVHRIGRTARAGAKGNALCFVSPQDHQQWKAIAKLMNLSLPHPLGNKAQSKPSSHKFKHKKRSFKNPHQKRHTFKRSKSKSQ